MRVVEGSKNLLTATSWHSGGVIRATVVVGVLVGVLALAGCTSGDPASAPRAPEPSSEPTTLASYDTTAVAAVRGPFCDRVSPTGIEHALGDVPTDSTEWQNGDRVRLPDGSHDRVQEFGCRWTTDGGAEAAAWVFVPPVVPERARDLTKEQPVGRCRRLDGDPFGTPDVTWQCTGGARDGAVEVRYAGLLGDAWLTCSLTLPATPEPGSPDSGAEQPMRASEWCVSVIEATRA